MNNFYKYGSKRPFLLSLMAFFSMPLALAQHPNITIEEIMADDGYIKQALTVTAMIKDCTATQNTYTTFLDCLAKKVGYMPDAPLNRDADNAFTRRQIRMLKSHCVEPLQTALKDKKYADPATQAALEARIIQCNEAIEALLVFLNKKEYDQK